MSARNLARHFVQETGITPREFVERTRIDEARRMLEGSRLPLKAIVYDCGYGTPDHMRVVFTEWLGVTPNQYRASFPHPEMDEGSQHRPRVSIRCADVRIARSLSLSMPL